jgi:hypothetical protein
VLGKRFGGVEVLLTMAMAMELGKQAEVAMTMNWPLMLLMTTMRTKMLRKLVEETDQAHDLALEIPMNILELEYRQTRYATIEAGAVSRICNQLLAAARIYDGKCVYTMNGMCVGRIDNDTRSGRLFTLPDLAFCMCAWQAWR